MKKTQMIIRPTEELKKLLQRGANSKGVSLNSFVINICWDFMEKSGFKNNVVGSPCQDSKPDEKDNQ